MHQQPTISYSVISIAQSGDKGIFRSVFSFHQQSCQYITTSHVSWNKGNGSRVLLDGGNSCLGLVISKKQKVLKSAVSQLPSDSLSTGAYGRKGSIVQHLSYFRFQQSSPMHTSLFQCPYSSYSKK